MTHTPGFTTEELEMIGQAVENQQEFCQEFVQQFEHLESEKDEVEAQKRMIELCKSIYAKVQEELSI